MESVHCVGLRMCGTREILLAQPYSSDERTSSQTSEQATTPHCSGTLQSELSPPLLGEKKKRATFRDQSIHSPPYARHHPAIGGQLDTHVANPHVHILMDLQHTHTYPCMYRCRKQVCESTGTSTCKNTARDIETHAQSTCLQAREGCIQGRTGSVLGFSRNSLLSSRRHPALVGGRQETCRLRHKRQPTGRAASGCRSSPVLGEQRQMT